jgi:hypothetical protein
VTGVSGSGKSTLINETLYPILRQHFYGSHQKPLAYKEFKGIEHIDKVMLLYDRIKGVASILNRSKPQSTAKALVFYYLRRKNCKIKPAVFGKIVQLSEVIILRLSGEISRLLNTQDTVDLL